MENEEEKELKPEFEQLVKQEPERDIDLSKYQPPKSVSEEEEETVQKSDLQEAMKRFFPKFVDKRINNLMQPAMVSRIHPENYMDKHFLITASLIEEQSPADDIDVVGIISLVQDGLSIGYEGRGRVEILEAVGASREEELEKLSKDLGL